MDSQLKEVTAGVPANALLGAGNSWQRMSC